MTEDEDAHRNYVVLLGEGVAGSAATELTSVELVLPFLYTSIGAPVLFAGLLVPVATVAKRAVQIFVAPLVSAARSCKRLMALTSVLMALAVALVSLTFNVVAVGWLAPIFLFVALVLGAANGLSSLAFQDLIGRILSRERRHRLLFIQSSLGGLIVVIIAFGSQVILPPGTSLAAHQELIWLGIGLFALAALVAMAVREPVTAQSTNDSGAPGHRGPTIAALKDSFRIALALPWFGRFLVARTLYLSIELAIPFFAIHAASFHGDSVWGLNAFIIAANVGLIIGGFAWAKIDESSVDRILILAAGITGIGGLLAMAIEVGFASQSIFLYAFVFVLVSLGAQGVKNGRTLYLIGMTTHEERPFCIAVANTTIGMVAIAFGALLGALAGFKGVAWPIFALVVLNAAAALYALRLRHPSVKSG
jgi:hypothetical protein